LFTLDAQVASVPPSRVTPKEFISRSTVNDSARGGGASYDRSNRPVLISQARVEPWPSAQNKARPSGEKATAVAPPF
jgi:hypothetical protein